MYKNIMIISSDATGNGHRSITDAVAEQFAKYEKVNVNITDGYSLSGNLGAKIGKLYGTITRASKDLWKMVWDISMLKPSLLVELIENSIRDKMLAALKAIRPDAIIVTHPNFNSSVLNILESNRMNIPLYSLVADPVSITPLWADARAYYTICPTKEAKDCCIRFGVPESRLKVFGFPVRERFTTCTNNEALPARPDSSKPIECLIMSGGEGSGNMNRIANNLLKNFNTNVKIICGRNKNLKSRLEHTLLEKYGDRIEIMGFSEDIPQLMLNSEILFTRASPNVMMEAVMCNIPIVVTGSLPGQEEGNPAFAEKYGLGVICNETKKLKQTVEALLANNAFLLDQIKESQRSFRDPLSSKKIVEFIMDTGHSLRANITIG